MRDPLELDGVRFGLHWLQVEEGVRLRVLRWTPRRPTRSRTVVFVPGWISLVDGWLSVLRRLAAERPVVYLESREKPSAEWRRRMQVADFRISRLGDDLRHAWRELEIPEASVMFGSSMGSNAILESLKHDDRVPASAAFLVGVNSSFRVPWWGHLVIRMPSRAYGVVREPIIWYLEHFRVNARAEPDQMRRYQRALRAAEPHRLKLSARAVVGYDARRDLDTVRSPVAVAFAATDTLHGGDEVDELVGRIPRGRAIACASNAAMHGPQVVDDLNRFLEGARA